MKRFELEEWFPRMLADPAASLPRRAFDTAAFSWRHSQYANVDPLDPFDATANLGKMTGRSLVIAGRHASLEEPGLFVETVVDFLGS